MHCFFLKAWVHIPLWRHSAGIHLVHLPGTLLSLSWGQSGPLGTGTGPEWLRPKLVFPAGLGHAQHSPKQTAVLEIALLSFLVCVITMKLIFHEGASCFLIRSALKIPANK